MSVCAGFARVFLVCLFRVAFGLFVVRRCSVVHGNLGLSGSRRFECGRGHRQHERRDCQNENEFLHRVRRLNTKQLELSTFRSDANLLILRRDVEATSSFWGIYLSGLSMPRVHICLALHSRDMPGWRKIHLCISESYCRLLAEYVFSVVAARAKGRGLQSAGVLVSEGGFGILRELLCGAHVPAG